MDPETIAARQAKEKEAQAQQGVEQRHKDILNKMDALGNAQLRIMQSFVAYLNKRVSKTEVTNQLKSIGTPDALKLIPALEKIDKSIKAQKIDWKPVQDALKPIAEELGKIPKSHPDPVKVPELNYERMEQAFVAAMQALAAPVVNVEAPIVKVPKQERPIVNTEKVDLKPFVNEVLQVLTDFRVWVQDFEGPIVNMEEVEKLLKANNELLAKIEKKKFGGGGGVGGGGYVFKESAALGRNSPLIAPELNSDGELPTEANLYSGGAAVSALNPVPITGNVTASGASLAVSEALNFTAHNLQSAAYSGTTGITNDYILTGLELNFSAAVKKTVTLTTEDGTVVYKDVDSYDTQYNIPFEQYFNGGEDLTLAITQAGSACTVTGKLTVAQGQLALTGNPVVEQATVFDVRQLSQFYNFRGQRYIATTGYVQNTLNAAGEPIALFKNPTSDMVVLFDKAEFGATNDVRFSRFGGGVTPLIGSPTPKPVGRTDGGASSSAMQIYTGGPSGTREFAVSGGGFTAGTLRKVATMLAYDAYQLLEIQATLVLKPGQQSYWLVDEAPGGGSGSYYTFIDFEWIEIPLATWNAMVLALQSKGEY